MIYMNSFNRWVKDTNKEKKKIKKLSPKDRLEYISSIVRCSNAIAASINGWTAWLTRPDIMNSFTKEDLEKIFYEFKKIALFMLEFDIDWSKKYRDMRAKCEDINNNNKKKRYIS